MPLLALPNEVLMEVLHFCTYNDLNALALSSRQLQGCAQQLSNRRIPQMHRLKVSDQGFILQYSSDSPRSRLFTTFEDFADCARKVRPKIHIMELVNVRNDEEDDGFLRRLLSIEVYRWRANVTNSCINLRFFCNGVMHENTQWTHSEVCPHKEDWKTLLHKCHTLKIECFEDPDFLECIGSGLAEAGLKKITETLIVSEDFDDELNEWITK
uniref:F-box domain-containing protein n=1 Tax=Ditylenchus dipsaci TaxID=166011 RepID=A0A915E2G1_9BILA